MGFAEDIAKLSEQIRSRSENVFGEEATRTSGRIYAESYGFDLSGNLEPTT